MAGYLENLWVLKEVESYTMPFLVLVDTIFKDIICFHWFRCGFWIFSGEDIFWVFCCVLITCSNLLSHFSLKIVTFNFLSIPDYAFTSWQWYISCWLIFFLHRIFYHAWHVYQFLVHFFKVIINFLLYNFPPLQTCFHSYVIHSLLETLK